MKTLTVVSVVICVSEATWPFIKKLSVGIDRTNFSRKHCRLHVFRTAPLLCGYISVININKLHVTTITNNNVIETNSILHSFIIKTSGM